jgi:hypothetical protein
MVHFFEEHSFSSSSFGNEDGKELEVSRESWSTNSRSPCWVTSCTHIRFWIFDHDLCCEYKVFTRLEMKRIARKQLSLLQYFFATLRRLIPSFMTRKGFSKNTFIWKERDADRLCLFRPWSSLNDRFSQNLSCFTTFFGLKNRSIDFKSGWINSVDDFK